MSKTTFFAVKIWVGAVKNLTFTLILEKFGKIWKNLDGDYFSLAIMYPIRTQTVYGEFVLVKSTSSRCPCSGESALACAGSCHGVCRGEFPNISP